MEPRLLSTGLPEALEVGTVFATTKPGFVPGFVATSDVNAAP